MDKTLAWLWLADAVGSGCQYAQELLTLYPDPVELYDALRAGTEAPPACLTPHALAQLRDTTPFDYEERLDHCLLSGIDVLTPDEGVYPDRLRDLPDLPLALYVTGDIACLNGRRYAGMVGTRRPSTYGRQAAFDLSLAMARAGVVLVSGLADGLDSEAHRAAVQADVPTVAFLGTAIDKTYPASNAKLRTAIEKGGGAVCSEYPPGYSGRTTGTFLARNRLIAAQSEALCVAEARTRSGTLNTVGHAERLGRPVLAVPGSIYSALSEGTNELLRTHRAEPLCKAADALDILGIGAETAAPAQQRFDPATVSADAQGGGAVCSEYPPGYSGRTTGTFLARNRLIAAQSEALCVAEARTRSGTLNTVGHAERLGRPVLAVPGSIYSALSEGTNELLRTHRAEPLCKAADALDILGIGAETAAPAQQRFDPATVSADAQAVYAVLKPTPQSIDALCAAASLPAGRVLAACTELELMGGAQAQPGRRYIAE